jgi:hypothetical protein
LGDEVKVEMGGACVQYKINSFIQDFGGVTLSKEASQKTWIIILKWIIKKQDGMVLTGFTFLRIVICYGLMRTQ